MKKGIDDEARIQEKRDQPNSQSQLVDDILNGIYGVQLAIISYQIRLINGKDVSDDLNAMSALPTYQSYYQTKYTQDPETYKKIMDASSPKNIATFDQLVSTFNQLVTQLDKTSIESINLFIKEATVILKAITLLVRPPKPTAPAVPPEPASA